MVPSREPGHLLSKAPARRSAVGQTIAIDKECPRSISLAHVCNRVYTNTYALLNSSAGRDIEFSHESLKRILSINRETRHGENLGTITSSRCRSRLVLHVFNAVEGGTATPRVRAHSDDIHMPDWKV